MTKTNYRGHLLLSISFALGGACGGGSGDGGGDAGDSVPIDAAADDWQTLVEGEWSLSPGQEGYFCAYATVERDLYIKAFRPVGPLGTHHTVLTIHRSASPADGIYPCNLGTNGENMVYGSGVNSPDFAFPEGVGLHLPAGTRLLLNLHLYNGGDSTLTGVSGTLFQEASAGEIVHEAELVLAGPTASLVVPTGVTTQSGTCRISSIASEPIQVFALSQHMHRLGRHMRSVITRGDQEIVLQDVPYDFEHQTFQYVEPAIELRPGDILTTYCTYENTPETNPPSGATVRFGDSSDDEMCFTDLFYYPAQGASFICTSIF
jgi:hypothetical protein